MKILLTVISCALIAVATATESMPPTVRLYKGSWDNFIETPIDDLSKMYPHIDREKNITMYSSGFEQFLEGDAVHDVMIAFIKRNATNAMLLHWEDESRGLILLPNVRIPAIAAATGRRMAVKIGKALANLIEDINFSPDNIQLYGTSLGAHVMGWIGKQLQERTYNVSRIYGLDPARAANDVLLLRDGLNPSHGQLVIGLHTNAGAYGVYDNFASIDFWANCDKDGMQPGCPDGIDFQMNLLNLCPHKRAWVLAIEALLNPNAFPAIRAESCEAWMFQTPTNSVINYFGENADPSKKGTFYFSTYSSSPYSKGRKGLRVN